MTSRSLQWARGPTNATAVSATQSEVVLTSRSQVMRRKTIPVDSTLQELIPGFIKEAYSSNVSVSPFKTTSRYEHLLFTSPGVVSGHLVSSCKNTQRRSGHYPKPINSFLAYHDNSPSLAVRLSSVTEEASHLGYATGSFYSTKHEKQKPETSPAFYAQHSTVFHVPSAVRSRFDNGQVVTSSHSGASDKTGSTVERGSTFTVSTPQPVTEHSQSIILDPPSVFTPEKLSASINAHGYMFDSTGKPQNRNETSSYLFGEACFSMENTKDTPPSSSHHQSLTLTKTYQGPDERLLFNNSSDRSRGPDVFTGITEMSPFSSPLPFNETKLNGHPSVGYSHEIKSSSDKAYGFDNATSLSEKNMSTPRISSNATGDTLRTPVASVADGSLIAAEGYSNAMPNTQVVTSSEQDRHRIALRLPVPVVGEDTVSEVQIKTAQNVSKPLRIPQVPMYDDVALNVYNNGEINMLTSQQRDSDVNTLSTKNLNIRQPGSVMLRSRSITRRHSVESILGAVYKKNITLAMKTLARLLVRCSAVSFMNINVDAAASRSAAYSPRTSTESPTKRQWKALLQSSGYALKNHSNIVNAKMNNVKLFRSFRSRRNKEQRVSLPPEFERNKLGSPSTKTSGNAHIQDGYSEQCSIRSDETLEDITKKLSTTKTKKCNTCTESFLMDLDPSSRSQCTDTINNKVKTRKNLFKKSRSPPIESCFDGTSGSSALCLEQDNERLRYQLQKAKSKIRALCHESSLAEQALDRVVSLLLFNTTEITNRSGPARALLSYIALRRDSLSLLTKYQATEWLYCLMMLEQARLPSVDSTTGRSVLCDSDDISTALSSEQHSGAATHYNAIPRKVSKSPSSDILSQKKQKERRDLCLYRRDSRFHTSSSSSSSHLPSSCLLSCDYNGYPTKDLLSHSTDKPTGKMVERRSQRSASRNDTGTKDHHPSKQLGRSTGCNQTERVREGGVPRSPPQPSLRKLSFDDTAGFVAPNASYKRDMNATVSPTVQWARRSNSIVEESLKGTREPLSLENVEMSETFSCGSSSASSVASTDSNVFRRLQESRSSIETQKTFSRVPRLGLSNVGAGLWLSGKQTSGETYVSYDVADDNEATVKK